MSCRIAFSTPREDPRAAEKRTGDMWLSATALTKLATNAFCPDRVGEVTLRKTRGRSPGEGGRSDIEKWAALIWETFIVYSPHEAKAMRAIGG
jgi:hypothetical protein